MSLFSQLRQLYRPDRFQLEDFHTEIVAQVLQDHAAELLGAFTVISPGAVGIRKPTAPGGAAQP